MRAERALIFALWLGGAACSADTYLLGLGKLDLLDGGAADANDGARFADANDGAAHVDAGNDTAFSAPIEVEGIAVANSKDDDPSLTRDLTLLYFDSRREGGTGKEDIWWTTRSDVDAAWGTPMPVAELNTSVRETGLALSADGLRIWFSSDRDGGAGGLDVYTAARSERSAPFGAVTRVASLCTAGDDLISAVDDGQQTAWLARRDNDNDDYDLFVARRGSAQGEWATATPVSELNTDAGESDAFAVRGGQQLIFTRAGDLYLAERGPDARYGSALPLTSVNSERDDRDAWASDDLRTLVFSSNRSGRYLLYQAQR